jgi:hypothetical protein
MNTSAHLAAAAATLLLALPARAHDPDALEALDHGKLATSDATPVGRGALEISIAWSPSWNQTGHAEFERVGPGSTQPIALGAVYGLTDDLDVSVRVSWATATERRYDFDPADGVAGPARGQGLSDTVLSARHRVLCRSWLDLAVVTGLVAPTGLAATVDHPGFTQGFWSGQAALVGSFDLGHFTANLEGGVSLPLPGSHTDDLAVLFANGGTGLQLAPWLQPTLEVSYQHALESPGPAVQLLAVTAGAILPMPDGYGLALGVQHAIWGRHAVAFTSGTLSVKRAF